MRNIFLLLLLSNTLLANELGGDITSRIENIYDVNLDNFCSKEYQFYQTEESGVIQYGCKNKKGNKHGLYIKQHIPTDFIEVEEYQDGMNMRTIFGADRTADMNTISMLSLIVVPEKYHGKKVRISGFYISDGREMFLLYNTRTQAQCNSMKMGIHLQLPEFIPRKIALEKFNNKYIYVEGVFSKSTGMFGHVWAVFGHVWAIFGHVWAIFGHVWAVFGHDCEY